MCRFGPAAGFLGAFLVLAAPGILTAQSTGAGAAGNPEASVGGPSPTSEVDGL